MVNNSIVRFVICPDSFAPGLEPWSICVEMSNNTTATHAQCCGTIVFTTTTVGSVGLYSSGLVDAAATILVLVAVLPSLACAGEPFKTELIFCELHDGI